MINQLKITKKRHSKDGHTQINGGGEEPPLSDLQIHRKKQTRNIMRERRKGEMSSKEKTNQRIWKETKRTEWSNNKHNSQTTKSPTFTKKAQTQ